MEYGFNRNFVSHAGVEHGIEKLAVGPFMAEVMFHEFPTVLIHAVHQMNGLLFVANALENSMIFKLARSIEKYGESIGAPAEKIRSATTDNNTRSAFRRLFDNLLDQGNQ